MHTSDDILELAYHFWVLSNDYYPDERQRLQHWIIKGKFSGGDILKRHFQKCSVRRGNLTGASHLSSPTTNLKKSRAAAAKLTATDSANSTTTPTTASVLNGAFTASAMAGGPMTSTAPSNFTDAPQMPYGIPNGPLKGMQL